MRISFRPKISIRTRQKISIKKVVADPKVLRKGVERYIEKIRNNEPIKPLIVFKHPVEDLYAILDGHHRFYALAETGAQEVDCVVIRSPLSIFFNGTKSGWFQPSPKVTKYMRVPMKVLVKYMKRFMKSPREMLKKTSAKIKIDRSIFRRKKVAVQRQQA